MKLKGKTIIEMTDVRTGQVTTFEDENFITNALSDICQPILGRHDGLKTTTFVKEGVCSVEALMRGLLLFDSTLSNDPSRYFPEKEVRMIGHGSDITYSGSDLTFGSFNENQSDTESESERTYVWDFTSEQANGIINSICLTTQTGGYIGYGTESNFDVQASDRQVSGIMKAALFNVGATQVSREQRVPLYLCFSGDYLVELDASSLTTNTVKFTKTKLSTSEVDIFKQFRANSSFEGSDKNYTYIGSTYTDSEEFEVDITTLGSGTIVGLALDGKHLYITQKQSSSESNVSGAWAANTTISIVRVDLETFSATSYTVTNTTGVALGIRTNVSTLVHGGFTFGVSNGYLFARSWESAAGANKCKLYAINLSDNSDVRQITSKSGAENIVGLDALTTAAPFSLTFQGKITFNGAASNAHTATMNPYMLCADALTFTLMSYCTPISGLRTLGGTVNTNVSRPVSTDNPLYHVVEHRGGSGSGSPRIYACIVPNVLMTINNLASPVEKTSAQTMRIIYKITKAE